ncbi:colanic acid exporter [Mycobacteroides abscessus subsp. abscessus]|nr:colanic acid exporter [Mycobacteroides abscessus subsp. abscessus]
MLTSTLLDTLYTNSYGLVIGKVISPTMLGYYNRANQFPSIIVNNVNNSLSTVLFPVMSASQEDKPHIRSMMKRSWD